MSQIKNQFNIVGAPCNNPDCKSIHVLSHENVYSIDGLQDVPEMFWEHFAERSEEIGGRRYMVLVTCFSCKSTFNSKSVGIDIKQCTTQLKDRGWMK